MSTSPIELPDIRLITVSGRIASGSTTLAKKLAHALNWRHVEGGEVFWEAIRQKLGLDPKDTGLRPDDTDQAFEQYQKKLLENDRDIILETKLAGFNAQGIAGVFKILVVCVDENGEDQTNIRIDRLVNREGMGIEKAKEEVLVREKSDIEKWQRLYAGNDDEWVYWDPKYYDLTINTYSHDPQQTLDLALSALKHKE